MHRPEQTNSLFILEHQNLLTLRVIFFFIEPPRHPGQSLTLSDATISMYRVASLCDAVPSRTRNVRCSMNIPSFQFLPCFYPRSCICFSSEMGISVFGIAVCCAFEQNFPSQEQGIYNGPRMLREGSTASRNKQTKRTAQLRPFQITMSPNSDGTFFAVCI